MKVQQCRQCQFESTVTDFDNGTGNIVCPKCESILGSLATQPLEEKQTRLDHYKTKYPDFFQEEDEPEMPSEEGPDPDMFSQNDNPERQAGEQGYSMESLIREERAKCAKCGWSGPEKSLAKGQKSGLGSSIHNRCPKCGSDQIDYDPRSEGMKRRVPKTRLGEDGSIDPEAAAPGVDDVDSKTGAESGELPDSGRHNTAAEQLEMARRTIRRQRHQIERLIREAEKAQG
jgi:Zn finger protein HypA/HybF involved in hydrogenase expression